MLTRKDQLERDKKAVFAKDIVTKNPIFSQQHIDEFYELFVLYADNRTRRADVKDIVSTAKTLGMDNKYKIIYDALVTLSNSVEDEPIDFETFITQLTAIMGNPYDETGRRAIFTLIDPKGREVLEFDDLKRISDQLKFNLTDEDIREVINNVSGFHAKNITWDKFNAYIQKKIDKRKE